MQTPFYKPRKSQTRDSIKNYRGETCDCGKWMSRIGTRVESSTFGFCSKDFG
jgi:hypothetical protein